MFEPRLRVVGEQFEQLEAHIEVPLGAIGDQLCGLLHVARHQFAFEMEPAERGLGARGAGGLQQRHGALGIGRAAFARDQHFRQRRDRAAGIGTPRFLEQGARAHRILLADGFREIGLGAEHAGLAGPLQQIEAAGALLRLV